MSNAGVVTENGKKEGKRAETKECLFVGVCKPDTYCLVQTNGYVKKYEYPLPPIETEQRSFLKESLGQRNDPGSWWIVLRAGGKGQEVGNQYFGNRKVEKRVP